MTKSQYLDLFKQSNAFFLNYKQAMLERLEGLDKGAVGSSRHISAWLSFLAEENTSQVQVKVNNFQNDSIQSWWNWLTFNSSWLNAKPAPTEQHLREWAAKTADYVLRAEEFLKLQYKNSKKAATYLPVNAHKTEWERMLDLKEQLHAIKANFPEVFNEAKQSKTWLTDELIQASQFVLARVTMFGLPDRPAFPGETLEGDELLQRGVKAIKELKTCGQNISQERAYVFPLVKKTRELTGANEAFEKGNTERHLERIPSTMGQVLSQFSLYIDSTSEQEFGFKEVSSALKADFPKPKGSLI